MVNLDPKSLEHGDKEIRQLIVVVAIERKMSTVPEASSSEDDRQVAVVVLAAVHVRAKEDHGPVEQIGIAFCALFQARKKVANRLHVFRLDRPKLLEFPGSWPWCERS